MKFNDNHIEELVQNPDIESYAVDIVFVIDGTGSMRPLIDTVKKLSVNFSDELENKLSECSKYVNKLRTKVIVFRDYYDGNYNYDYNSEMFDNPAMQVTPFFDLKNKYDKLKFENFVNNIKVDEGGDIPENGLEALALAFQSDFIVTDSNKRHIIIYFSDAYPHKLKGELSESEINELKKEKNHLNLYPQNMPNNMIELNDLWNELDKNSKRLIMFAPNTEIYPDTEVYKFIGQNFEFSLLKPVEIKNGGRDITYDDVFKLLVNSF